MKNVGAKLLSTALIAAVLSLSLAPACPGGEACGMSCCRQAAARPDADRPPQTGADCCAAAPAPSSPAAALCDYERPDAASAPGVLAGPFALDAAALEPKTLRLAGVPMPAPDAMGWHVQKVPIYLSGQSLLI